ncbi:MAG: hypothetical protein H6Q00_3505, partial [Holophagaceae bacterium]|nr:hypothetical protein [Holophagaceae bacterium]
MSVEPGTTPPKVLSTRLIIGIVLIVLGGLLALDSLNLVILPPHFFISLWPLILVVIGIIKLRRQPEKRVGAYALIILGALFLLGRFSHEGLSDLVGPLILVAIGIFVVLGALKRHRGVPPELKHSEDFLQGTAILSGFKQRVTSAAFKGGEVTAIMGGFEVDLRPACIAQESVRLDIFALFGGGEIRVPEGWNVVIQATAIAGGVDNKFVPTPSCDP